MKILFECDNGCYVVQIFEGRLYAKVDPDKGDIIYDGHYNLLINPGSFHEYRKKDTMLQNRLKKLITEDLEKAVK